ncbi:zinc-ribbon domain-containing protein, partial [Candidatus Gracilibacteria bacterium]|nr:zinc-ribbon domain-containing protein [Candidatus Gracilibacteria bacterium]
MITCPTCGAQNDPGNRFCDQCGTRLEAPAPAAVVATVDQPTVAASICPNCGATVVPGEAFCDNCGAALAPTTASTSASTDAPTMLATPAVAPPIHTNATVACPSCGHMNLPGESFCENCGADLSAVTAPPAAEATPIAIEVAPPNGVASEATTPEAAPIAAPVSAAPVSAAPVGEPTEEVPLGTGASPEPTPPDTAVVADNTAAETVIAAPPEPPAPPPVDEIAAPPTPIDDAERQRLEAEIVRQEQIIAQFEQMQATFGAATPPAVVQGLADARAARDQAASDLAALAVPAA